MTGLDRPRPTTGSTVAIARMAAKSSEMAGIGRQIGHSRTDHTARPPHPSRQAPRPSRSLRAVEYEPQPLLHQLFELTAAQRRLRFGTPV
jgi:hypothetical protein